MIVLYSSFSGIGLGKAYALALAERGAAVVGKSDTKCYLVC